MSSRDVSFASFNLLNLQLPGKPMYSGNTWTEEQYESKLHWSANILRRLNADFIGFQELWAHDALTDLLDRADLSATHTALVEPDHSGGSIVCAGAVRSDILIGEPKWITEFPSDLVLVSDGDDPQTPKISVDLEKFSRPVLHARIRVHEDTPEIQVFVCHFKSRRPTKVWLNKWYDADVHRKHATAIGYALSTVRRTAEAAALRAIISNYTKNTEIPAVVLGDMNDGKSSNTLNILTEQPQYLSPLSAGGADNALYTAQTLQEYRSTRDVYYTHVFKRERESLDHILFSEQFYDLSKKRLWAFDEMTVENDHLNFDDHKESGTSDHGIVRTAFRWKPA